MGQEDGDEEDSKGSRAMGSLYGDCAVHSDLGESWDERPGCGGSERSLLVSDSWCSLSQTQVFFVMREGDVFGNDVLFVF